MPNELPDDLPFEGWVSYVFDHPSEVCRWWWLEPDSSLHPYWDAFVNPPRTLEYLTRLFANPAFLIDRFSREQIDWGLNFLVNECSDHMFVLTNTDLAWEERRECFDAMIALYRDLMAPVYGDNVAHGSGSEGPNFACYMWWDVIPIYGGMDHPNRDRITDAVLNIFEQTLDLKSEACLESVLHGLSHWHLYVPNRTEPLVRRFLTRTDISKGLRSYAETALHGRCL